MSPLPYHEILYSWQQIIDKGFKNLFGGVITYNPYKSTLDVVALLLVDWESIA